MADQTLELIAQGGCLWKRQFNSPGFSLVLAIGTAFKVALEGPSSNRVASGVCRDGYFEMVDGVLAGKRFLSANEAVNAVREPSSNAYLHVEFHINGRWIGAETLRYVDLAQADEDDVATLELAMASLLKDKGNREKLKIMDEPTRRRRIAQLLLDRPDLRDAYRPLNLL